jgi:nucleoside-diphosphate-sugar epimerase
MRILVTGAAGLIGSGVAAQLKNDYDVVGLDLVPGPHVQVIADCHDVAQWRHEVGSLDAVVHVAALHVPHVGARSDADFRRINVEATARLVDLASDVGAGHFVLTSTTSLFGHALEPSDRAVWVDETLEPQPRDIYDETKLEAEELVARAGGSMTMTSLRMSRCFPEPVDVMAWYRLYRGVDRRDVAEAHALALQRSGPPTTYLIGAKTPFRPEDCEELLSDAPAVIRRRCPRLLEATEAKGWRPPRSIGRVYDCGLAMRDMGYSPRFGIEQCLAGDWDPSPAR